MLTFLTDKGNSGYIPTFSIEDLSLNLYQNGLTVRLFLSSQNSSSVTVGLDTKCSLELASITIRYLVIVPPLPGFVNLVYFTNDPASGILLKMNTNYLTMNQSLSLVANQTKSALFLMGVNIQNNQTNNTFLDLYCKEILTDSGVTVNVTTKDQASSIYLYHISLVVVTVNTNFTFNGSVGTF